MTRTSTYPTSPTRAASGAAAQLRPPLASEGSSARLRGDVSALVPPAPPSTLEHPSPAGVDSASHVRSKPLGRRLVDWLTGLGERFHDAREVLRDPTAARWVHEFADAVTMARDPETLEAVLVRIAGTLADAPRVELWLDRDTAANSALKRVALWPESGSAMTDAQVEALGYPLCLGLWCGDHYQMSLQVYAPRGQGPRWPRRVVRRLTTLCAMAAAAERGMHVGRRGRLEIPTEKGAAVRDATFLCAVLPYALSQAHRHREPLSLFCIEIDGIGPLSQEHGRERMEAAVNRVAEATARTLRGSDVVTRLDDGRVFVILPNTGVPDAPNVAETVRKAVINACLPVGALPELTFSIGVSCFPEDGGEMTILLATADEAMTCARMLGRNQVVLHAIAANPRPAG
jgi:diguanylate cyclase (GGDEF)-like protein